MGNIPQHIVDTINTLLAPFGESFDTAAKNTVPGGYVNYRGAAKYTGLSVSTLRRAVESGMLKPPYRPQTPDGKNRATVFSLAQLDDYIQGR